MLDTETKRRIDTARDILVGKVPDPKSQVEQITIALIYKFMDDMDLESEELGGDRSFFKGEFEKYAWRRIFDPRMGGFEILNMYSEAIMKMNVNPNIPQLFRDIFKNAYLPYRDPETLKAFLKIINDFNYDHSEKLGDAFEYLLSVLGSQGEAGQFRTPRHIIDFMVAIIDPKKEDVILDPACGTAGFLISSYKHILKNNSSNYDPETDTRTFETKDQSLSELIINSKNYKGDKLTPDERSRLAKNIKGYDISPDMVRLSLVNMYLHGLQAPRIAEYDTLTSEDNWNEYSDVILANPPFMSPKGGIRPHKRFSISSSRSEVLFVDYIAEHLTPNGKAAVIVPEGIIFQSGTAYKNLRKMLVENYLVGVISLPAGVFQPYSGVKTSILLLDKTLSKKTDKILFVKIESDGFDLGAQRRPIKQNDLPYALEAIQEYFNSIISVKEYNADDKSNINTVGKEVLLDQPETNLSSERYLVEIKYRGNWPLEKLENLCSKITDGSHNPPPKRDNGKLMLSSQNIFNNELRIDKVRYISETDFITENRRTGVKPGDVLLTIVGTIGRCLVITDSMPEFTLQRSVAVLKPLDNINSNFLSYLLQSNHIHNLLNSEAKGVAQKGIYLKDLKDINLPLPPLSVQEEIVAEIDSYQKIIDGARQVVDNYKPRIDIDPEWEMVELGKVCEINPKKSEVKDYSENLEVSFVPMADVNENQMYFEPGQSKKLGEVYKGYTYFKDNDVLLAQVTPCFENGKAGLAQNLINGIGFGSSEYIVLRANDKTRPKWIYLNITSDNFRQLGKERMTGTGGLQRVPKDFVSSYKIPLPSIEIQSNVIENIDLEIESVETNKNLILAFEQKIKDRIAKVWG